MLILKIILQHKLIFCFIELNQHPSIRNDERKMFKQWNTLKLKLHFKKFTALCGNQTDLL